MEQTDTQWCTLYSVILCIFIYKLSNQTFKQEVLDEDTEYFTPAPARPNKGVTIRPFVKHGYMMSTLSQG